MSTRVGRVGEYYAAAALEFYGADVAVVRNEGADIIAFLDGESFRVEVKSAGKTDEYGKRYAFLVVCGSAKRPLTTDDCDIVALVAIPERHVIFRPVTDLFERRRIRIPRTDFTDALEQASFDESFDKV